MRTTVVLDDDTNRAVQRLQQERGLSVSQAVNELIRRGLLPRPDPRPFRQRTAALGLRVAASNVAQALEDLGGPAGRHTSRAL